MPIPGSPCRLNCQGYLLPSANLKIAETSSDSASGGSNGLPSMQKPRSLTIAGPMPQFLILNVISVPVPST